MKASPVLFRPRAWARFHLTAAVCLLAGLSATLGLHAQNTRTGQVSGLVSNQATGDLLPGAVISVDGGRQQTVSERGGGFSITLPEGTHTLVVSYSGLDTLRMPVSVSAGQTTTRNIELTSGVYQMETFSVSGVREGSALAIQNQRLADNPKWVVATDTFGNPAANPGELIQRLPGISTDIVGSEVRTLYIRGMGTGFSSMLVDGDRMASSTGTSASRDFQIEQLGTGNVESVELIKAPLPDQDANAVAGYVNLVTRRGFDASGRRITATAGTLWRVRGFDGSPFKDRADNVDLLSFAYSDVYSVFGGARNLGVAFNVNRRVSATTQDEIGPAGVHYTGLSTVYLNAGSNNPLTRIFGTGDFGYDAIAHNAGLSIDYKLNPDAFVYFKVSVNSNDQHQEYLRPAFGNTGATAANFTPDSSYEHSILLPHANSTAITESSIFTKKSFNYAFSLGGEQKLFDRTATLSLRASYSHANIHYPAWIRARAVARNIGFEIDRRGQDPWYPIFRQVGGPSIHDADSYNMSAMTRQSYKAPNELFGFRADFKKAFETAVPTYIKVGAKYNDDSRKQRTDLTQWTWVGADGAPNSDDDSLVAYEAFNYKQGDGRYGPFPFMNIPGTGRPGDPVLAPQGHWQQTAGDAYNSYATSNTGDAQFSEKISAAYIQGNVQLGKLRVLGGVRVEETETEGTAWVRNTTASWGGNSVGGTSLDPTVVAANVSRAERSFVRRHTGTGKYRDVFPGIHFVYEPIDSLLLRVSYNRAIARPPIASLLPTISENQDNNTITLGNPALKPYHTNNFEFSVEKYFEPVGQLSVGVFLKEISDYFRSFQTTVPAGGIDGSGTYAGYTLNQSQNVGNARVRGFEVGYQQQFSFLPGVFKGLGAFANYTYLESEGDFGGLTTTTKLANLSPRSGNAGINYRIRGLDVRFLANWKDENYQSTNGGVDIYMDDRLMLDIKLQYSFNRRYDAFLDMTNITDEAPRAQITKNGLHFFKTNQGVGFVAGVRGRF